MRLVQAKVLDSRHLELAKPIDASCGLSVFVVVTDATNADAERRQWNDFSSESLERAYGDSEPEYTPSMVRETNPGYGQ